MHLMNQNHVIDEEDAFEEIEIDDSLNKIEDSDVISDYVQEEIDEQ